MKSCLFAQEGTYVTPEEATAGDEDFQTQGEYVGPERAMQVIAMGEGDFEAVVYAGGLPGAGWDKSPPRRVNLDADQVVDLVDANQMKRVHRTSPTLGMEPPANAIVLFDGTEKTLNDHWTNGRMTDDGLLIQGVTSKDTFQDFTLHIEFRTPYMPRARGQGRGNSGVYYQGRYETQVLDSFGLAGKQNETGGIYSIRDPDLNMCLPPLSWQTYDADFTAARFDDAGKKISDATLTVRLNGVVVHQDIPLTHKTTAAPVNEGPEPGPIYLQDHGNPVRYRNIWVIPRDAQREARRPRVPGFERFFARSATESSAGGELLINELGCVSCHDDSELTGQKKHAPILDQVGGRLRPDHLLAFIRNPHDVKPGTTMPTVALAASEPEQEAAAKAIASYLLSTGTVVDRPGNPAASRRGQEMFHMIGCVACHTPQDGTQVGDATSIPFGKIAEKYTLDSLQAFLKTPHAVRPSGRMPSFGLNDDEATDLATYLLGDVILGAGAVNVKASFYEGRWETLPDFSDLKPYLETETYGLDLKATEKRDRFGVRFETYFKAPKDAKYKFHLASDDGSRLLIDDKPVVVNDGIHPMSNRTGEVSLKGGVHQVIVEYFELAGEESLTLEVEGGGISRAPIEALATLDPSGAQAEPLIKTLFQADPSLVDQGRTLFATVGCASCHQLKEGESQVASQRKGRSLMTLDTGKGCLAEDVPPQLPQYDLTSAQRMALAAAIDRRKAGPPKQKSPAEQIHHTMATMNCYACHTRDAIGGPEGQRNPLFKTTMREMGDEGRVPPMLTGVGDKLNPEYLKQVLDRGADERPYMLTNMPGFGVSNLPGFVDALISLDQRSDAAIQTADLPEDKLQSAGRVLAGNKGMSCVKCHVFGGKGAPGIGAIDMQRMTTRLREDWFHRYLIDPQAYRPGTRMPASFPDGKSVVPGLLDGHPAMQVDALWKFLSAGDKARPPIGVEQQMIELVATDRPVIYRNFIEGLSPRGIAVGYPEHGNLAWDAESMSLAMLWKGAFIDAGKHWLGRGPGNQSPLGDEILKFETMVPVASLSAIDAQWTATNAREAGYRFLGYRLNQAGQPTFRYGIGNATIEDMPRPEVDKDGDVVLRRDLRVAGAEGNELFVVRLAKGKDIQRLADGWFSVDQRYHVRVDETAKIVDAGDSMELRQIIELKNGAGIVRQTVRW
ncbi:MAG: family 16 glycoside hydrolase [Pirellulaceae bacterium]